MDKASLWMGTRANSSVSMTSHVPGGVRRFLYFISFDPSDKLEVEIAR